MAAIGSAESSSDIRTELSREVGYVILYAIGDGKVEVLNGKERLRLPISWLKPLWQGNIIELWQAPLKDTLRLDMEGLQLKCWTSCWQKR